ncbi:MAG: hypothetical protein ACXVA4_00295 [Ktedonobacterales bacterium]
MRPQNLDGAWMQQAGGRYQEVWAMWAERGKYVPPAREYQGNRDESRRRSF